MKKILFLLLGILSVCIGNVRAEQWRLHPTFSPYTCRIIDTPDYTYILKRNQFFRTVIAEDAMLTNSLFRYDKKEKETLWLNPQNKLSSPVITNAEYNFSKRYLLVVYDNGNIDLIYDNGNVVNVPALMVAEDYGKSVNSITMLPEKNEAWLATSFGYIVIDDNKGEIKTSKNLNRELTAAVEYGGDVYFGTTDGLYRMNANGNDAPFLIEPLDKVSRLILLGKFLYIYGGDGWKGYVRYIDPFGDGNDLHPIWDNYFMGVEPVKDGLMMCAYSEVKRIDADGNVVAYAKDKEAYEKLAFAYTGADFLVDQGLKGVVVMKGDPSSNVWQPTGEVILPNAANGYKCPALVYSDKYGMLVRNHGYDMNFVTTSKTNPDLISGLRNMDWTSYSVAARCPEKESLTLYNPNGAAIDPDNKDMMYCGSILDGILRLNLSDPSKSLRIGLENDPAVGKDGFIGAFAPDAEVPTYISFSAPAFDKNGVMWAMKFNIAANNAELWHWNPEDRRLTSSASDYRPMKGQSLPNVKGANVMTVLPLTHSKNTNLLLIWSRSDNTLLLLDHKGTVDNAADDRIYLFPASPKDQDGNQVSCDYYHCFYEDPSTGMVWVGHDRGVFWINPSEIVATGDYIVNRVKVPRNDGTNFADYLLDGVILNVIAPDGNGRLWFGTNSGGLVCTSSSGREILKTYTSENSYLPSNQVYGLCHNPENNSMMISTDSGLAELYLNGSSVSSDDEDALIIYPNPVRPDFYGYVTIEGLEDNALVKIADSAGNIIKELDIASNGETRWDVTNLHNKRVRSGVYYVLSSGSNDGSGFAAVGKILVVN